MTPCFSIRSLCALIASAFSTSHACSLALRTAASIPASAARDALRRKALASLMRSVLTVNVAGRLFTVSAAAFSIVLIYSM